MEKKVIMIKSEEEVKEMTVENTSIDASLRERFIALKNTIEILKAEKDKIQEIVLDAYGHKPVKTGEVFKAVVYDKMIIDEELMRELFGTDAVERVKVKPSHVEYIKA